MATREDLTGRVFGRLTVIGRSKVAGKWDCVCACGGAPKPADATALTRGRTKSCGCYNRERASNQSKKDLTGRRFGKLTAVKATGERVRGSVVWECECDCGKTHATPAHNLTNGTSSCGCGRMENLAGKRFGRLTAVRCANEKRGASVAWECVCDCGRPHFATPTNLKKGSVTSCGCFRSERTTARFRRDISGQRFGRLVAKKPSGRKICGNLAWECACDCGASCEVKSSFLVNGTTSSCGCLARETTSIRVAALTSQGHGKCRVWLYEKDSVVIRMRSSWEVIFARWLDDHGEPWVYEPKTFKLAEAVRYMPDFYLPDRDLWVEVKGFLSHGAAKKIEMFRQSRPLVLVQKDFILRIAGVNSMDKVTSLVRRVA